MRNKTAEPTDDELRDDLINQLVQAGLVEITSVTQNEYTIALTPSGVEMCGDMSDIEDWGTTGDE